MHSSQANDLKSPLGACTGILTCSFGVYLWLLTEPLFISEYGAFYVWNEGLSLQEWAHTYFNLTSEGWYRPTAFFSYFQLLQNWIHWHDIFAIRIIAIGHMVVLGIAAYAFIQALRVGSRLGSFLGATIVSIHPLQSMQVVDLIHFDTIYQTCILLLVTVLWRFDRATRLKIAALCSVTLFLWLVALTSKEQSIALGGFLLGWACWNVYQRRRWTDAAVAFPLRGWKNGVVVVVVATSAAFAVIRYTAMGDDSAADAAYRTSIDLAQCLANLRAGVFWLGHWFLFDTPSWQGYAKNMLDWRTILLGFIFTGSAIAFVINAWRKGDASARNGVVLLLFWILTFSLLPIYSGGRPWHFGLPLVGVAALSGNGMAAIFLRIQKRHYRESAIAAFLLFVVVTEAENVMDERALRRNAQLIVASAVDRPPIPSVEIPEGSAILYPTDGSLWAYGDGYLWRFAYQRKDLEDVPLPSEAFPLDEKVRAAIATAPATFFFVYNASTHTWSDRSETFRQRLSDSAASKELTIDFADPADTLLYAAEGLSGIEAWGRWSDGPLTQLKLLTLPSTSGALEFQLQGVPYLPQEDSHLRLVVRVGEVVLGRWEFPAETTPRASLPLRWEVPASVIAPAGPTVLEFHWEGATSPAKVVESDDNRVLGLGFESLTIRPKSLHAEE